MRRSIFLAAALLLLAGGVASAQKGRPAESKEAPAEEKAPELTVKPGLFGVAQHEKDWYFDVPDSLLGRRILAVTRYVSNTAGAGEYGGEEVTESMVYWEKASNGNLLLRCDVVNIKADQGGEIGKAVAVSSENPIVASLKPEKGSGNGFTRVKVTSLFEGDTQVFSLGSRAKRGNKHSRQLVRFGRLNRPRSALS